MKIRKVINLFRPLRTISLAITFTIAQQGTTLFKVEPVKAQSSPRPYVVLANGYQDCCTWYMDKVVEEFRDLGAEIRYVPWDSFKDRSNQRSNTSNDAPFIAQGINTIRRLDRNRPIIMIGHSYGADSLIKLVSRITNREILFLGVIDPVAGGGFRVPVTNYTVTSNVHYFFNRWQENGLAGDNVVPLDSRLSGKIRDCDAVVCDQQEQSIVRKADGSSVKIPCEGYEVTCPGYEPWPGGENGEKQKRMYHNDMAYDLYIQQQIVNKVKDLIASESRNQTPDPEHAVRLQHVASNQCIYGNSDKGGIVRNWSCWNDPNMVYYLVPAENGTVRLRHFLTGNCIYVKPVNDQAGRVANWPCWNDPNMRFKLVSVGNEVYRLRHIESGMCLFGREEDGAKVGAWKCWADPNMEYQIMD